MRRHFYFRPHGELFDAWDVAELVAAAHQLPVFDLALENIGEIDSIYWVGADGGSPTVRTLVRHMELARHADLGFPIILSSDGRVMDGMHRVAKALLEGLATIRAVRFVIDPAPQFVEIRMSDLADEAQ